MAQRVLVLEDNDLLFELYEVVLQARGLEVTRSVTATAAFEACATQSFALVVSDLRLPDVKGYEVLEGIREALDSDRIPIVCVSGDWRAREADQALAAGATACLTKPVDVNDLGRCIDELLSTSSRNPVQGSEP